MSITVVLNFCLFFILLKFMNLFLKLSHSEFLFLLPECIIFNSNTCSSVLPATGSYLPELTGYSVL